MFVIKVDNNVFVYTNYIYNLRNLPTRTNIFQLHKTGVEIKLEVNVINYERLLSLRLCFQIMILQTLYYCDSILPAQQFHSV